MGDKERGRESHRGKVELLGIEPGERAPRLKLHALDRDGDVLESAKVDEEGNFELSRDNLDDAHRIVLAARETEPRDLDSTYSVQLWPGQLRKLVEAEQTLVIGRGEWAALLRYWRCVSGSVWRCASILPTLPDFLVDIWRQNLNLTHEIDFGLSPRQLGAIGDAVAFSDPKPTRIRPWRCEKICEGEIEVYSRTCCCRSLIIDDSRILNVIEALKEIAWKTPVIEWPPGERAPRDFEPIKAGALDELRLNASRDLNRLLALSGSQQLEYVADRPYLRPLWCSCGPARRVATGEIRPDGTFHICWRRFPWRQRPSCHEEYAFVVRQNAGGGTVTVYDGVAANRWVRESSDIDIHVFNRAARACPENPFPGLLPYAMLFEIGDTKSFELHTPDTAGWDSVEAPFKFNHGLLRPEPDEGAARGQLLNCNLGGTLKLRYLFSPALQPLGAMYYRISVAEATPGGEPVGTFKPLSGAITWTYSHALLTLGGSESLGPVPVGDNNMSLHKIPYPRGNDEFWDPNQYHGYLDTTGLTDGRHLLMLEIFDEHGKRLAPDDSDDEGATEATAPFTFAHWKDRDRIPAEVKYAALTHLIWVDNREATARLVGLSHDGSTPSDSECQFLVGNANSTVAVRYRAFHPDPLFIRNHSLKWRRGWDGPDGTLVSSSQNTGTSPDWLGESDPTNPEAEFAQMLGKGEEKPHKKCSFSLNLHVGVKTTDGEQTLTGSLRTLTRLNAYDQAAFALEIRGAGGGPAGGDL